MKIVMEVEDTNRGKVLLEFLKQLPFVKIKGTRKTRKGIQLNEVFGIWKNREITKGKLRKKAWRF
ncbi:MAG TPA: hypothetical protein ENJ40_10155 [Thermosulfurimonas dismutans]|uniref:Uncharacterized protein n=1 Tax=Thermosulfurimonas dismutans TaxID=999894 RepID=A0A7C3CUK1_9BACT|nr:hypothetical protein [Thermosulfurimonas dismutans]